MHLIIAADGLPHRFIAFEKWVRAQEHKQGSMNIREIKLYEITLDKSSLNDFLPKLLYFSGDHKKIAKLKKIAKWLRRFGIIKEVKTDNIKPATREEVGFEDIYENEKGKQEFGWGVQLCILGWVEDKFRDGKERL